MTSRLVATSMDAGDERQQAYDDVDRERENGGEARGPATS